MCLLLQFELLKKIIIAYLEKRDNPSKYPATHTSVNVQQILLHFLIINLMDHYVYRPLQCTINVYILQSI